MILFHNDNNINIEFDVMQRNAMQHNATLQNATQHNTISILRLTQHHWMSDYTEPSILIEYLARSPTNWSALDPHYTVTLLADGLTIYVAKGVTEDTCIWIACVGFVAIIESSFGHIELNLNQKFM